MPNYWQVRISYKLFLKFCLWYALIWTMCRWIETLSHLKIYLSLVWNIVHWSHWSPAGMSKLRHDKMSLRHTVPRWCMSLGEQIWLKFHKLWILTNVQNLLIKHTPLWLLMPFGQVQISLTHCDPPEHCRLTTHGWPGATTSMHIPLFSIWLERHPKTMNWLYAEDKLSHKKHELCITFKSHILKGCKIFYCFQNCRTRLDNWAPPKWPEYGISRLPRLCW